MKLKALLGTIVVIIIFSFHAKAQMTGGGSGNSGAPLKARQPSNTNKWATFHLGLSQPMGKFKENDLTKPFEEAVGAKPGFYLGFDGASYGAGSDNPFNIGFTWNTTVWVNNVNWGEWVAGSADSFEATPFLTTDLKLGVIGTYELAEDMYVDGFLRLGVNLGIPGTGYWNSTSLESESLAVGFGTTFGANFRYKQLFTTMQFLPGKMKYSYYSPTEADYKLPISTFRLGVGVILRKR